MSVQCRVVPESFKREAVGRVSNSGLSAGAVAREPGLHESVLRRWMTQCGMQADGDLAAIYNAGVVSVAVGFGRRGCLATEGRGAVADGAGHPKKLA